MELIKVTVKFTGILADLAGVKEDDWEIPDGITIAQLFEGFKSEYGEKLYNYIKKPEQPMTVSINGREANAKGGWNARLRDKDTVSFLAPYGKMVMLKDVGGGDAF